MCGLEYAGIAQSYDFTDADQKNVPEVLNYLLLLPEIC